MANKSKAKAILIAAGLSLSSLASPSIAGEDGKGWYVTAGFGGSDIDKVSNSDFSGSPTVEGDYFLKDDNDKFEIGVGYDWGHWRMELGYEKVNHSLKEYKSDGSSTKYAATSDNDVEVTGVDLSLYYDFENVDLGRFTPFVGAGVGISEIDVGTHVVDGTTVNGGSTGTNKVHATLGTSYQVTSRFDLIGQVGFVAYDDVKIEDNEYTNVDGFEMQAGVRFRF